MPRPIHGRRREVMPVVLKTRLCVEDYETLRDNADDAGLDMAELNRLALAAYGALTRSTSNGKPHGSGGQMIQAGGSDRP